MSRGKGRKEEGRVGKEKSLKTQNGLVSVSVPVSVPRKLSIESIEERLWIDPRKLLRGPKIGEGAHGKVYEGRYGDQIVAIKILNCGNTPEDKAAILEGRFAREVAMMSRVNHKNLVKFIGACKNPMVITTELLPGMSLRKYMASIRPKQLDLHVAIGFAVDIACAMECLHANGIIHRDLKPDNLLLTENQESVKLADFGLAREETVTEMMTAETGTYRWMAPELYSTVTLQRGQKIHYNNKVDVYSFGFVLWELLTNRMPFEGMSSLQAAYAAFKNVRPELPKDINPKLALIIQSCWVEDPNLRPSFDEIIPLLNAFLSTLSPRKLSSADVAKEPAPCSSIIVESSAARARWKATFLRQFFASARSRNT